MQQPIPKSAVAKHIGRLISRWPTDPVRPSSVSVQTYLQSRLDPPPPPSPPKSSSSSSSSSSFSSLFSSLFSKKTGSSQAETNSTTAASASASASASNQKDPPLLSPRNINALYSLLENRYQNEYPLPHALRRPRSQPGHYDVLLREFEEAPRRGWLGRLGKRLSGALRMK